ncbi:MAG TPA: alpha-2-macroglobulin [candidate division Zixibacteria bacterium]|nr:hypothetical protein [candidate division Zixibacteria bacterium]MDD4918381.1 alpha-2-macroglobulin [candidate division Zixibacteria bacterium]MDM7973283.1 alpha-2-macroglobulin [candidate division Zixibacteria bacterium]HPM38284.1 alpha-2-macroglobulin [candidate division Zixibacteria bacterium]
MRALWNRLSGRVPLVLLSLVAVIALATTLTLWAQLQTDDRNVRVKDFRPQETTDRRTNVTITFSADLVSPDSLNRPVAAPPVSFEPPLAGAARWIEPAVLRFFPESPLAPATAYTATVASDLAWRDGRRIAEKRTFSFRTDPLSIMGVSSYTMPAEDRPGHVRVHVDLRFNYPIFIEDLTERLTIEGKKNAEAGRLSFSLLDVINTQTAGRSGAGDESGGPATADIISLATDPVPASDSEQVYLVTIRAGVDCPNCGRPLERDHTGDLVVPPRERLVVHEVGTYTEGIRPLVYLSFSTMIATDRVEDFVAVEPAVDFRAETRFNQILLTGAFTPGETYTVSVASGLRSQAGAVLADDFSGRVTIQDIPPTVLFRSEGIYLPRENSGLLEIETINVDSLAVEIEHIFANNLVYALAGGQADPFERGAADIRAVGRTFFTARHAVPERKNEKVPTTVDVAGIVGDTARGIYKISAYSPTSRWVRDSRLALLTDLGLIARLSEDYLVVWVNRLSTVEPVRGAEVRLYSRNNQLLLQGRTDSRGAAVFEKIVEQTAGFEPYVITVEYEGDLSYLRFAETGLDLTDFEVKGRPLLTRGYEAFVYTDRGVYRPGETTHVAVLVRAPGGAVPADFPYFLNIKDPTGRDFQTVRLTTGRSAFAATDLALPEYARTGKYTAIARIGDDLEIGRTDFQVEEFVPDRIKVSVETARAAYTVGENIPINVAAEFLFGSPAANHAVAGRVQIEPHTFVPSGYSKYSFADSQRKFMPRTDNLPDAALDGDGRHTYSYTVPRDLTPPSALRALIGAFVSEQGGRAVSGYREVIINPYPRYVGVRLDLEGYATPGEPFAARVIALNPEGRPVPLAAAEARLYRVTWNTVLTRDSQGRYRYKSERDETLLQTQTVALADSGAVVSFTPDTHGEFRLVIADPSGGHSADVSLYASGWGYAPWSMEEPERIEIGLDKTVYRPGEDAVVQIRAPFGGTLLVTVEKETVHESFVMAMPDNTAEVRLRVKDGYFPNAYVTATVLKKAAEVDRSAPARAFGIAPLFLQKSERDLNIALEAPEVMQPHRTMTVGVRVGVPGPTQLTLAVVDAGILQLTGFAAPDPLEFFYGQRAPSLRPYDIYSFLYPNIQAAESHLAPGGDRFFEAARRRHLNPFAAGRVQPVALWSGLVTTDASGRASIDFRLPAFNGRLVLMAVAAQGNRFGSAVREVTVRENLIVQESFPRFVSPNDVVTGLVTVFNHTGDSGEVTVELELDGPAEAVGDKARTIALADGAEGSVAFTFKAGVVPGPIAVRIRATAGADQTEAAFQLPNRPARPLSTRYGAGVVTDTAAARIVPPADVIPRTARFTLQTSSLNALQFRRQIEYLLSYPYGCVEQTTSRVFPLLYFESLARFVSPELLGGNAPDYFVQEGIRRLGAMMRADGTFSFWPGGGPPSPWTSVYAGHFLLEARQAGFVVEDDLYEAVRKRLLAWARGRDLTDADAEIRVYAAYALASTDQLDRKILNELRQIPIAPLSLQAKFHLAGALALAGDRTAAFAIIDPIEIQPAVFPPETGGTLASGTRTSAVMLDVLARLDPDNPSAAVLARDLTESARVGRWYTTQESAFALMALGRYLGSRPAADFTGRVALAGDSAYTFDETGLSLTRENFLGREVTISIDGAGPCYYYWQLSGVSTSPAVEEFARGIRVAREYLDADGNPLELDSVRLGDQVICRIEAIAERDNLSHVAINDLLPAGFAVENPRLKTTPRLAWIPRESAAIGNSDIRDDRVLLFVDLNPKTAVVYHYSLRAVAAGEFQVPPIAAECMYNPVIAGASGSGVLTVRRPGGDGR